MLSICKEMVVFLILAKMLEGFQNSSKYSKFVKLVISLIVVLKFVTPIATFFQSDFDLEKITAEIEKRFVIESESVETPEEIELVETVEILKTDVSLEEIWWEK